MAATEAGEGFGLADALKELARCYSECMQMIERMGQLGYRPMPLDKMRLRAARSSLAAISKVISNSELGAGITLEDAEALQQSLRQAIREVEARMADLSG